MKDVSGFIRENVGFVLAFVLVESFIVGFCIGFFFLFVCCSSLLIIGWYNFLLYMRNWMKRCALSKKL